jgi:prepilin-type N-terminal cleavage/methylation domain-containing protein
MQCKSGFTLIELLVYMAIMGFIIVVAGKVFSDATGMRVRSQNMLANMEQLGKLSSLISEDISQMGAKAWGQVIGTGTSSGYEVQVVNEVYIAPAGVNPDSSSYRLFHRNGLDSIIFRKMAFSSAGQALGVREISWAAREDSTIHRRCRTIASCVAGDTECANGPCGFAANINAATAVLMGTGVTMFHLTPSTPGVRSNATASASDTLFKPADALPGFSLVSRTATSNSNVRTISASPGASSVNVSGFVRNLSTDAVNFNQVFLASSGSASCLPFSFRQGETYVVEFQMPLMGDVREEASSQFQPGVDHIAVGLRRPNGTTFDNNPIDVLFFPAQSTVANTINRYAEFSLDTDMTACIALTFSFYSPQAHNGTLSFQDFRVIRKTDEAFHFLRLGDAGFSENYGTEDRMPIATRILEKNNAKAFEMILEVERSGEISRTASNGANGMIILTPNNGIQARGSTIP